MANVASRQNHDLDYNDLVQVFIDQHRAILMSCLDGLTETEARTRLVDSKTTLLSLVKHATFVERVWFGEAASGIPRTELGLVPEVDMSFDLNSDDTIVSIKQDYAKAIEESRQVMQGKTGDDIFPGNRRGPLPARWVLLHLLRELAQHCGHADILREQLLSKRQS